MVMQRSRSILGLTAPPLEAAPAIGLNTRFNGSQLAFGIIALSREMLRKAHSAWAIPTLKKSSTVMRRSS